MERNIQKNGLINLLLLLAVGAAGFAVASYAQTLAGQVAAAFLGLGVLVAAVSLFQMRLEERERLEKLEFDEVTKGAGASTLFNTQEAETFPARRSREQFEKFFVPGFAVLLFLLEAGAAFWLWRWLQKAPASAAFQQTFIALALLGLLALVSFILGQYSANLARLENQRLLRPGANFLLFGAYLFALVDAGIVAVETGVPNVDRYLARGLCAVLAVLAVEMFFTLLLEIYRPRVKGKAPRLYYESRLIGLFSHPEGLFTTAAHALDYQFGFKVSDTWFYQFLQKNLPRLLLAQAAILVLSTSFVFIEAGEEALLERFGRPLAGREVLAPGAHLKLPWPVDRVHRFRTQEIQSFNVGAEKEEDEHDQSKTLLWTVAHLEDESHDFLVASREAPEAALSTPDGKRPPPPVNLLAVGIPVQFQISDLRAWAYNHQDAAALLERIGTREVARYLVSVDLNEMMSSGRFEAGQELRERIQTRADELQLGVRILFVGLQDAHPPVKVALAYEAVIGARQKREADILNARAHSVRTNALASSESLRKKREAEADRQRTETAAVSRAALFTNQMQAFAASPTVYPQRAYLQTLARGGAGARKIILGTTNTQDVILLNLEEKIRTDLLDVPLPAAKPK